MTTAYERISRCAACAADGESYPMPATLDDLCNFHRQIIEAKCEGPTWGKEPIDYFLDTGGQNHE